MADEKTKLRTFLGNNSLGTLMGDLTEFREIGEGGNGLVFEAKLHDKPIAIKFLTNTDPSKLARFKAEFFNVISLPANPYIVKVLHFEEFSFGDHKTPFILMEKYDGSLLKIPLFEEFKRVFDFLLNSVDFIHSHGIIHRDLKPQNILTKDKGLFLTDFGIAHFDPENFALKAKTKKGERFGNRLFSAPEQEKGSLKAHPTMDIFSIGQICQWFCTGEIHRGTKRTSISSIFPEASIYESIIDRCLAQRVEDRFQTICEIRQELKKQRPLSSFVDPYPILRPFGKALSATFPKGASQASFSDDKNVIDRLLNNFIKYFDLKYELWWLGSKGENLSFQFSKIDKNTWLLMDDGSCGGDEIRIKSVWAFHNYSLSSDLVLLNLEAMPSFDFYEGKYDYEEVALVDDEFYISRKEFDSGFAEVGDDIIDLSKHKVCLRTRKLEERSIVVTTRYHCAFQQKSEITVKSFLKQSESKKKISQPEFLKFVNQLRKNEPLSVKMLK